MRKALAQVAPHRKEADGLSDQADEKSDDKKAGWRLFNQLSLAPILKQFLMTVELIQFKDLFAKQVGVLASLKARGFHPTGAPQFCDVFLET